MMSRRHQLFGPIGVVVLVLCGAVTMMVCLFAVRVVTEIRKDPLQSTGEHVFSQRAQRLAREVSLLPAEDPPAGHVDRIVAAIEGGERTHLGLAGRVYLVDVDDDFGRVEAIFIEYVQSGGGWLADEGEATVCVRWDVERKSAVYSDITARAVSCP
ncbi:hypothetical protein [Micromonospora sp. NBC_01813]|uniref:hypothetical protein n=1 Tax=Micromonospora sp. NBC_01813 TaxID=2975988 RepID=UPI002DD87782|nr:hypothetical protein [Micromonospora sp. NBC_01813]WSA09377.1 hypothetical protein OG958_00640 [Micromonospora sp. NBC_01813]